MNQIHAMRVFVTVVDSQSFRRAAQQLDVSNALVTRSVAMLEAHLHTRLINRTTRNLSLTEAGLRYLEGCRCVLEELDHLESTLAQTETEPGGTLRVVASGALTLASLTPLIEGYKRRYPHVLVRLTLAEREVDLVEDGFDVGIVETWPEGASDTHDARATQGTHGMHGTHGIRGMSGANRKSAVGGMNGTSGSPALVERALGRTAFVPCASPAWLAEHGEPRTPEQLALHAAVALPPEERSATWRFARAGEPAQTGATVTLEPGYEVNNLLMVRLAALAGMGVAIVPAPLVADDIARGALRRLLPDYEIDDPEARTSIVWPSRQYLPAKTRRFVDYALEHFTQHEREPAIDGAALSSPALPAARLAMDTALQAMSGS
ncbi:LysR family transcriptional regulator [Paraburkholderia acidisoli]|uniref:LysR family transcriptional regulator n=1 Tax=Paraburkholderia acidisoli TaxID=2571748 RepID=A0A7Z2GFA5_9BURK|nr:LysR family transcriptional regulator [Paraburkholderia acidisoli]